MQWASTHESLRALHLAGLADHVVDDVISNVPLRLVDRKGKCVADVRPSTKEFGWSRRNIFMQQNLERELRRGLGRFDGVHQLLGHDVVELATTESGADLHLTGPNGETRCVTARSSSAPTADAVRSAAGRGSEWRGDIHPHKWVVVDCKNDSVDAPYTALHCDPARPSRHRPSVGRQRPTG